MWHDAHPAVAAVVPKSRLGVFCESRRRDQEAIAAVGVKRRQGLDFVSGNGLGGHRVKPVGADDDIAGNLAASLEYNRRSRRVLFRDDDT